MYILSLATLYFYCRLCCYYELNSKSSEQAVYFRQIIYTLATFARKMALERPANRWLPERLSLSLAWQQTLT